MIKHHPWILVSQKKWLDFFLVACFLSSVFQDFGMVVAGLYSGLPFGFHQNFANNPYIGLYFFKVAKYVFFILALSISLQSIARAPALKVLMVLFLLILPSLLIDIANQNYLLIGLGIKAALPIFAYFIGMKMDAMSYKRLVNVIKVSLWINFITAAYQLYSYTGHISFTNQDFLSIFRIIKEIRVGGAFLEPNTLGLYGLICILVLFVGARLNLIRLNFTYVGLSYFLIITSWSRTAMVATTVVIFMFFIIPKIKNNNPIYYFLAVALLIVFSLMLFGRGFLSIQIRLRDFEYLLLHGDLFVRLLGNGFGYGTLSSATFGHIYRDFSIPVINGDSQWIAFYIQGGYWLLIGALGAFLYAFFVKSFEAKIILISMCLVGFGIQFIEAWPYGFLAFALIGYCSRQVDKTRFS